jgi:ABC-type oligopeptide transport system substrate-binding subunit
MHKQHPVRGLLPRSLLFICLGFCLLACAACGSAKTVLSGVSPTSRPQVKQTLLLPDVGIQDLDSLDPAQGTDENSQIAMNMLYSGLVRQDSDLNIVPDQATWTISTDRKTYTFALRTGIMFSDGTAVTAQTYVYSLTRALLPAVASNNALLFLGNIVGATAVNSGKTTTLSGVRAVNPSTLVITLIQPTEYFLQALATSIAFPVNQSVIQHYGEGTWTNFLVGSAVGTGPFLVKQWARNTKMVMTPNPYYYGTHPRLSEVDIIFAPDAHTAFQAYQGGQYSLDWNILPADIADARGLAGYVSESLLETDALFFDTQTAPFNQLAVRQAFAYAIDKNTLAQSVLSNAVVPAPTIIPPGLPDYQPTLNTLGFNANKALASLKSAYPDTSQVPPITFYYPNSLVSPALALALQGMWQNALGIPIKLVTVDINAYNDELANHKIPFGFTQWDADFPDPYDALALNLLPNAAGNSGNWTNTTFEQLVQEAEQTSGDARMALYAQAEQIAITDVGWLPLDHQTMSAIIPASIHGISLNHEGLYFGDWSGVYLT